MGNYQGWNEREYEYVAGNVAPAFDFEKEAARRERIQKEQEEAEKRREELIRKRAIKKLAVSKRKSRINLVAMLMATVFVMASCVYYINLRSEYNSRLNKVNELENKVITLNENNNAYEKRIETSINLSEIKDRAINELKMVYPTEGQIQYYHIDNTDYMEQYKDIPNGRENSVFGMIFVK
ncbi:MAG: hypothetical protein IJM91_06030 [Lachnospiraceae bacterium]|nr:hypothetical protein [Lachnospiraceae bacterium]